MNFHNSSTIFCGIGRNFEEHCFSFLRLRVNRHGHAVLDDFQSWATPGNEADFLLKTVQCPNSSALLTEPPTLIK